MSGSKGCETILLVTEMIQIRSFTMLLFPGETGGKVSVQIRSFTSLAVRFDRSCCETCGHLCPETLTIAHVHDLLRMDGLSFQVSFTKNQYVRSRYRRSSPNSLVGFPSPTLSVHSLNLRKLSLHRNRHMHQLCQCTDSAES